MEDDVEVEVEVEVAVAVEIELEVEEESESESETEIASCQRLEGALHCAPMGEHTLSADKDHKCGSGADVKATSKCGKEENMSVSI